MPKTPHGRPRRTGKGDRLTGPDASADETACDHAVAPFDLAASRLDRIWGYDRLPALMAPDVAAKYGARIGQLNDALRRSDVAAVTEHSAWLVKALARMHQLATEAGHPPADPSIIECETDGWRFGLLIDQAGAARMPKIGYPVFSLAEIGRILKAVKMDHNLVQAAKDAGGEVVDIRAKMDINWKEELEDEIPF